jgi:hypothetical protein
MEKQLIGENNLILIIHTCIFVEDDLLACAHKIFSCISFNCQCIYCISTAIRSWLTCTTNQLNHYSMDKITLLKITHKLFHSKCSQWQNPMRNIKIEKMAVYRLHGHVSQLKNKLDWPNMNKLLWACSDVQISLVKLVIMHFMHKDSLIVQRHYSRNNSN